MNASREWDTIPLTGGHVKQIMLCALAHNSRPDPVLTSLRHMPSCGFSCLQASKDYLLGPQRREEMQGKNE